MHFQYLRNEDGSIGDEFWIYNFNISDLANDRSGSMMNNSLSSLNLLHTVIGIGIISVIKRKNNYNY